MLLLCCSPCPEEIPAQGSIRTFPFVCTSDFSYLFDIARTMQDVCIRTTEVLVAEAFRKPHLDKTGHRRVMKVKGDSH